MGIGLVMLVMGIGSAAAVVVHSRDTRSGKPARYPLSYDVLGAVGFLAFGVGTLLKVPFFTGSGRWWLLLLIPVAVDKWRRTLAGRRSRSRRSYDRER
jgi:hypothetical protein